MNLPITTETGAKIGQTTWHAEVYFDNGQEFRAKDIGSREFPLRAKGLAIHYVKTLLLQQSNPEPPAEGRYWGQIQQGTYADDSFEDYDYHLDITDGTWEPDEESPDGPYIGKVFYLTNDGTIDESEI